MFAKQKEIIREFNFTKALRKEDLPGYIKHYVLDDELILAAYKTPRDHVIFSDTKITLFDNDSEKKKKIFVLPYRSISTIEITFADVSAEINIYLTNSYPVRLNFVDVKPEDKVRLRLLYTCINRVACNREPSKDDVKKLLSNKF